MLNDINFSNSFRFAVYKYNTFRHIDHSHGIKTHYFAYMVSGRAKIQSEDDEITVSEGDVFYIPNGAKYHSYWYGEPKIEFISLAFVYMPNYEGRRYELQIIRTDVNESDAFYELSAAMPPDCQGIAKFYALAARLIPKMSFASINRGESLVELAKKEIAKNPHASVRDIAKLCAVSESALYLAFKRYSEQSVNEYKKRVIMEEAKELLISTDISIEELSRRLSFSSSSYFRKCFKSAFGITPLQLRRKYSI